MVKVRLHSDRNYDFVDKSQRPNYSAKAEITDIPDRIALAISNETNAALAKSSHQITYVFLKLQCPYPLCKQA